MTYQPIGCKRFKFAQLVDRGKAGTGLSLIKTPKFPHLLAFIIQVEMSEALIRDAHFYGMFGSCRKMLPAN